MRHRCPWCGAEQSREDSLQGYMYNRVRTRETHECGACHKVWTEVICHEPEEGKKDAAHA